MDAFNVIAGAVTIIAAIFAFVTYLESRRKGLVETQKAIEYQQRLADLVSMTNSIAKQVQLMLTLSDRDDVTKKELKHLLVATAASVQSLQSSTSRMKATEATWRFGLPVRYLEDDQQQVPAASHSDHD